MARSRNIKPAFFKNDELAEIDPLARLLFIGLWTISDFNGRLEYRSKRIKAEILPYDVCEIDGLIEALSKSGFITIYHDKKNQERKYIEICNFKKHQNPHPNEKKKGSHIKSKEEYDAQVIDNNEVVKSNDNITTSNDDINTNPADSCIPYS